MSTPKICLDPGHGGSDPGATGSVGLKEKNLVLDISLKLRDYLLGGWECEIKLTRKSDVFIPLIERSRIANDWGADLFYSIHCNGHTNTDANGWESFIYPSVSVRTEQIQRSIHRSVWKYLKTLHTFDRGLKRANFQVLRNTVMSAVLGEYLFVSGNIDRLLLKKPEAIDGMAKATAQGIAGALNLKKKAENKTAILGELQATAAQMKKWAKRKNVHQRFNR